MKEKDPLQICFHYKNILLSAFVYKSLGQFYQAALKWFMCTR